MTLPTPPMGRSALRAIRGRAAALLAGILLACAIFSEPLERQFALPGFDAWQRLAPRQRTSAPALIVAIDEASLQAYGAWPWPRRLTARLLAKIAEAQPAAVGIDVLFAEPDRFAPERLSQSIPEIPEEAWQHWRRLGDGDASLARAVAAGPFVIARAGVSEDAVAARGPGVPFRVVGADALQALPSYPGLLRSEPQIEAAAPAQGLVSANLDAGVVRRLPLVFNVGGQPMPALSSAMLFLASGAPALTLVGDGWAGARLLVDGLSLPLGADGQAWIRFSPHDPDRFISAQDLLAGRVPLATLERKLVLVGFAAHGLSDIVATPLGERIPGVEVHAQLLENVFDETLLRRPGWLRAAEFGLAAGLGLLLVLAVPVLAPARAWALATLLGGLVLAAAGAAWRGGWLFDAVLVLIVVATAFAATLGLNLAETERQRRRLKEALAQEREAAVRIETEFAAAQRVQLGMLPVPSMLPADHRYQLAAAMVPARQVGGDLYDFFLLDADRLFFLIGDVSGKGLAASIFMALSKALCKSLALRDTASPSRVLAMANAEIARDNPELLFITALAGRLDLRSGELLWSRAGHDAPYLMPAGEGPIRQLTEEGGPPLCVVDDYPFADAQTRLQPGDTLVLLTDGILEAQDRQGSLYGRASLDAALESCRRAPAAQTIVDSLLADVARFSAGREAADDATVLVIRWPGPGAGPALG